jgi:hypothetical protein
MTALSRVSAPISLRQQHHLAFIPEFKVQMLYQPGLKNVVVDFFVLPLPPSSPTVGANRLERRRRIESFFKITISLVPEHVLISRFCCRMIEKKF